MIALQVRISIKNNDFLNILISSLHRKFGDQADRVLGDEVGVVDGWLGFRG